MKLFRLSLLSVVLISGSIFFYGCDSADDDLRDVDVTVMSYNLYLGADIFALVGTEPTQIPLVAAQLWAQVQATDFPTRAQAIAAEIAVHEPELIGLQEVTLYRTQTPSDYIQGVTEPNATEVAYDFLQILLDELEALGLDYRAAAVNVNADVELPMTSDGQNFTDIRLTDRDVILARGDVSTSHVTEAVFSLGVTAPVPVGGQEIPFLRGYSHLRAEVDGVSFSFANTHLEVQVAGNLQPQDGQAAELIVALANVSSPLILVGDFNNTPGSTGTAPYALLSSAGYTDAAVTVGVDDPTCCQAANLLNPTSTLTRRIDLIFSRGRAEAQAFWTVGNTPDLQINGLWPSDHAGVVARFTVTN